MDFPTESNAKMREQEVRAMEMMKQCRNTNRELWRENPGDFYSSSIHVTKSGGIGINCGGHIIVAPLKYWHEAMEYFMCVNPSGWLGGNVILREATKMAKMFWVARDQKVYVQVDREITISKQRLIMTIGGRWLNQGINSCYISLPMKIFKRIFGLTLKPGEIKKMKMVEVKE